jgi:hypothetical protein
MPPGTGSSVLALVKLLKELPKHTNIEIVWVVYPFGGVVPCGLPQIASKNTSFAPAGSSTEKLRWPQGCSATSLSRRWPAATMRSRRATTPSTPERLGRCAVEYLDQFDSGIAVAEQSTATFMFVSGPLVGDGPGEQVAVEGARLVETIGHADKSNLHAGTVATGDHLMRPQPRLVRSRP